MRIANYILGVTLVMTLMGFQYTDTTVFDIHPRARSYFMSKVNKHKAQLHERCHNEALAIARERVDSILIARRILVDVDSFFLRPRPRRPGQPNLQLRDEHVEVVPIFDSLTYEMLDSATRDSLLLLDSMDALEQRPADSLDHR